MDDLILKIERKVKKELDQYRYMHTLGVMYTAASLAMRYQANVKDAMIAGLLHDCAKCIPGQDKIRLCKKYDIDITPIELSNPGLLHAKLGAYLAKKEYQVENEDILQAIRSHTTGRPDMSLLEKIIYIADYIEPGRNPLPNMDLVRKLAFEDLDECLFVMLKDSLEYLNSRNIPIDPMTEQTYEFYNKIKEKRA